MHIQLLNEGFERQELSAEKFSPARVPGSVIADLLEAGELPDPYYRDNEKFALSAMEKDYRYRKIFCLERKTDRETALILRLKGLDTIAKILLNGKLAGTSENMHRTVEIDVTDLCTDGDNVLEVIFLSPTKAIREAYHKDPVDGTEDAMKGFVHLRKAHYMFGWDWGPRIPDAGIFRSCELLYVKKGRISDVFLHQEHKKKGETTDVSLTVSARIKTAFCAEERLISGETSGFSLTVTVLSPDGRELFHRVKNGGPLLIEDADLWWPNEAGTQPLYQVVVTLFSDSGEELDERKLRIGLRTMTMNTKKDEFGSRFAHLVNGVELFAMGADYIPEDNIISRITGERTRRLLQHCKDAHFNCIRVWGGGFYPNDEFFDICDELGLMVWQDFMFACGHYRFTEQFRENVEAELTDNIRRIRHHACLALFCGNNEMELFTKQRTWNGTDALAADYLKMYEEAFPAIVRREAPDVFYWPASPSSGGGFDEPNDENRGDVHYWEVWHGNQPFTEYRRFFFRYLSEFGFQSFPSLKTVEAFTEPSDRNIFSYVFEKHQRNAAANGKILGYLAQMYRYPYTLSGLIYASQLLQAEAIKYGVEHFRRNRGRCMGTVYWQLNDCWPVASWSSIDYFGRLKALHYYAKRFYAPVLLSCEEHGMLGTCGNLNAEELSFEKSIMLCVTNDTQKERKGTVQWQLRDSFGGIIREWMIPLVVPSYSAVSLDKQLLPELSVYDQYVSFQYMDDEYAQEGTVLFCPPKHFRFQNPQLSVELSKDEITVKAFAFAKSVQIQNGEDNLVLSDNFFDMNAGEKTVKILSGFPEKLMVTSVYSLQENE